MATCGKCDTTWTGMRAEHCAACHETFTGTESGDRHRAGDWTDENPRRCLSHAEMRELGLGQDDRGMWQRVRPHRMPRFVGRAEQG